MKKKYLFGLFSAFVLTAVLASCSSNIVSVDDDNSTYVENQDTEGSKTQTSTKTMLYDPVYESTSVSLDLTEEVSKTTSVEETVEKVYDSVVSITASSMQSSSAGSGVLFAEDTELGLSYLVTCFHVIEDASVFEITMSSGETYQAELVGGYQDLDLAVLSIETTNLTYASLFSNSDELKLGSTVVAIGNPLGTLPGSVSAGVISYVNRSVQTDTYTYRTLLQTDVAINSGNSGGGLFNTAGALIGIVNAKYSSTGVEGLGSAIPSNDVVSTINSILKTAKYDTANKVWNCGYVEGDYEYGFTITLGYYTSGMGFNQSRTYVYYVSDVNTSDVYTGKELNSSDIVKEIKVDYYDESKEDITYTVSTSSDVNEWLYTLDLSLDDTLYFTVTRNNQTKTIAVDVCQYIYSI